MIGLVPSDAPTPRAILDTPGAFCWWYVDLVNPAGDGLVLIWSYGLPFLPGVAGAARKGQPQPPRLRPSVNLATYRRGLLDSYVLHELAPEACSWGPDGDSQTMGDCSFQLRDRDGRRSLDIHVDLPLPATAARLQARIQVDGPLVRLDLADGANPMHAWGPVLTAARGRGEVFLGEQSVLQVDGAAYHDRNSSGVPLGDLGIHRWRWARLAMPDQQLAWYQLDPERRGEPGRSILVQTRSDGAARVYEDVPYRLRQPLLNPFLLGWHRLIEVDASAQGGPTFRFTQNLPVDSGPFYLRFLTRGQTGDGQRGVGTSELVAPARIDLSWMRPMIRLRVSSADPGSWLQPLFTGPMASRPGRFVGQLWRPQRLLPGVSR